MRNSETGNMSDKYPGHKPESCWLGPICASSVRLLDQQQMHEFRLVSLLYLFVMGGTHAVSHRLYTETISF